MNEFIPFSFLLLSLSSCRFSSLSRNFISLFGMEKVLSTIEDEKVNSRMNEGVSWYESV